MFYFSNHFKSIFVQFLKLNRYWSVFWVGCSPIISILERRFALVFLACLPNDFVFKGFVFQHVSKTVLNIMALSNWMALYKCLNLLFLLLQIMEVKEHSSGPPRLIYWEIEQKLSSENNSDEHDLWSSCQDNCFKPSRDNGLILRTALQEIVKYTFVSILQFFESTFCLVPHHFWSCWFSNIKLAISCFCAQIPRKFLKPNVCRLLMFGLTLFGLVTMLIVT